MTHSPFLYKPGFLIWHSQDLVNWEPIIRILPEFTGSAMAPDLVKYKGRFYLYYPANETNWVTYADNIKGPWSKPIDLKTPFIDPGHSVGEDGKRYLHTSAGHVVQLADDGLSTVGEVKTEALKRRLLEINPAAQINAIQKIYNRDNHDSFELEQYDYIIDAIDSLGSKTHLIRQATRTGAAFFSSMGASLKLDPTRIKVGEFWEVKGCPLASKIRKMIRKGDLPAKKFMCVYSDELLENKGSGSSCGTDKCLCPKNINAPGDTELADHEWCSMKAVINGTVAHITAIFGFTLAGLVIQDIYHQPVDEQSV